MPDLKVAYIQTGLYWEDKAANLNRFDEHFAKLNEGVDLVILPEMFNTGFSINPEAFAEEMNGSGVAYLIKKAGDLDAVIIGSLLVKTGKGFFNRLVAVHPGGKVETYDKRHLFRLSEESRIISGGDQRLVVNVKGWKIRPLVCYDLRFPVWSKNTYSDERYEYDVLVYVANWPASRSNVWKTLLTARAMENQVYCIGVNRIGEDGHGTSHSGDSMAVDSKGKILSSASPGEEAVNIVTLSKQDLELYRVSFTLGMDWDRFSIEL
ncbi:MAG: amidohydrolase [Bacteroidetes bacterium]|nr:amidohydrolase [Bacteroidota bacterium]